MGAYNIQIIARFTIVHGHRLHLLVIDRYNSPDTLYKTATRQHATK